MSIVQKTQLGLVSALTLALLTGCGGSSSSGSDDSGSSGVDLPDGKNLVFIDRNSAAQYQYDTTADAYIDLNEKALNSTDGAIQNLELNDTSIIGSFFFWADDSDADGEVNEEKILLMLTDYSLGDAIDHTQFFYLAHFHGNDLAAHASSEFDPATYGDDWEGSRQQKGLARLNTYMTEQKALFDEVSSAVQAEDASQTLCQVYVDPHAHSHEEEESVVHMGLTQSGRIYFFEEAEGELAMTQGFVPLEGVSTISNCSDATITRVSDDGVLVFVAETQRVYLVDNHGADYHQHSKWDLADFMPAGFHADLMAAIGEGSEHDHEH